ncbi:SpoIID/LytB domain-containing protein [Kineothrix sedimenti]|uniref:SpoIID/LytB domain-containing protein n=1 Tax=Kineothrix sedimenti TaxID=3123317 RepID=A0ABZ3ETC8_9FIRM
MNKNVRMFLKMLFCIVGLLIIVYILAVSIRMGRIKQPEGEYIRLQDVLLLSEALEAGDGLETALAELKGELAANPEAVLTYEQFLSIFSAAMPQDAASGYEKEYEEKYKDGFFFLKEDWYRLYDSLLTYYDMRERIAFENIVILGTGLEVWDEEGNAFAEKEMLTEKGRFFYASDSFPQYKYQVIKAYKKDDIFLAVYQAVSRGYSLHNTWLVEAQDGTLRAFVQGYEIEIPYEKAEQAQREQIADMEFADGILQSVKIKNEKINGKLLSFGDGSIEIEGYGKYPYDEGLKIYKLYGTLSECGQEDLRIGYNFTDFVLEDGIVCAGLITRDEAMENIRVVIKNTDFASAYHEKLEFTADTDFTVSYGNYNDLKREEHKAGEKVVIDRDSEFFAGERVYIEPTALTGRIQLLSIGRAQGTPAYRGKLEISRTSEGLVAVNEVLLEEYLYSVVPSEMPASYPLEALKAQAICARTYAYRHMSHSGIAQFGAHVDDSAGYQVYNNIAENAQTTKAVKDTAGELLYYGEELCGSYYYSTSCGFGSDTNIWKSDSEEDTSYLVAKRIGEGGEQYSGEEMTKEDVFASFIGRSFDSDYEKEEAWYRWKYEVEHVDSEKILASIQKRYEANEKLVLTKIKDGSFSSEPVKKLGEIKNIYIEKRNSGGAADELIIEGTKNTYKIISEHNIRYVLSDGESMVIRQDGSEVATPTLLPSAYMTITTSKEGSVVVGYTLVGGGYGHGVGMSQNGAKAMANTGFDAQGILSFFYQTCEIKNAY